MSSEDRMMDDYDSHMHTGKLPEYFGDDDNDDDEYDERMDDDEDNGGYDDGEERVDDGEYADNDDRIGDEGHDDEDGRIVDESVVDDNYGGSHHYQKSYTPWKAVSQGPAWRRGATANAASGHGPSRRGPASSGGRGTSPGGSAHHGGRQGKPSLGTPRADNGSDQLSDLRRVLWIIIGAIILFLIWLGNLVWQSLRWHYEHDDYYIGADIAPRHNPADPGLELSAATRLQPDAPGRDAPAPAQTAAAGRTDLPATDPAGRTDATLSAALPASPATRPVCPRRPANPELQATPRR